ncbi:MAG: acyltransferase [Lachnospiraceae bacterium]|nr:acyltransferase [Lachnospiraceae bacterium]
MERRKRVYYIDGIRFFAVLLVVISHFNVGLEQYQITIGGTHWIIPSIFANGDFGTLGVSLFFIISGFSLYYNYENDFNVRTYFKKRFLSIYPQFWCSYILVFCYLFFNYKEFWFEVGESIPTKRFLLTILGMDGYFLYLGKNFYLIGEWFLGCIILIYLIFPLLRVSVKRHPLITGGIATIIYILVVIYNPFKIGINRNLLIQGYSFLLGMLLVRCIFKVVNRNVKLITAVICILIFIISINFRVENFGRFMITISGISLFVFMSLLFETFNVWKASFVKIVNKYSYDIFLLHHVMISVCLRYFRGHEYSVYEGIVLIFVYIVMLSIVIKIEIFIKNKICTYISKYKNSFGAGASEIL